MQINRVLTGIAVSDMDASVLWYEAFLGTPASARPMPILAASDARIDLLAADRHGTVS
jgi:hypothetical protein